MEAPVVAPAAEEEEVEEEGLGFEEVEEEEEDEEEVEEVGVVFGELAPFLPSPDLVGVVVVLETPNEDVDNEVDDEDEVEAVVVVDDVEDVKRFVRPPLSSLPGVLRRVEGSGEGEDCCG